MQSISVINASTTLTDAEVSAAVPDLQTQVSAHFAPVWAIDAQLQFCPRTGSGPVAGSWWLVILDDADQAAAVGYHDLTAEGLPLGKVFARTDQQSGHTWTVTASHELLEMLADPWMDRATVVSDSTDFRIYAYEVCDACEDDGFGYWIDRTRVSDFVFPAWFNPGSPLTKFDYCGQITRPLQLLAGGYIGVFDPQAGWKQQEQPNVAKQFADRLKVPRRVEVKLGGRRERRVRKAAGGPMARSSDAAGRTQAVRHDILRNSVLATLAVLAAGRR